MARREGVDETLGGQGQRIPAGRCVVHHDRVAVVVFGIGRHRPAREAEDAAAERDEEAYVVAVGLEARLRVLVLLHAHPPRVLHLLAAPSAGLDARSGEVGDAAWMGRLLLLFVLLPAVELALLIEIGSRIGTGATLAIIVVTGFVGAALARRQGLGVLRRLQEESQAGQLPAGSLVDGVLILVAAALLVTPGVVTDAFGFLCLVPAFRGVLKREVRRRLERAVQEGRVSVNLYSEAADDPWGPRTEKVVHDLDDRGAGDR